MKSSKTRRILMLLGCAVLLVCLSVGATLAYLTSQTGVVTNTFTVGKVEITLDEAKVDVYGKEDASAERVTQNTYKLIPGHHYTKDPTIHVAADSEDCWLFVKVANGIATIEKADPENPTEENPATTIAGQMTKNNGWTVIDATKGIYAYKEIVSANANVLVFESFTLSGDAAVAEYNGKTITVQAYAVQADGFDTAADAYDAAPLWGVRNPNP